MGPSQIDEERLLRIAWWGELQGHSGPSEVAPAELMRLRVYGGQRGVWVDKKRTGPLTEDGQGIAVALLGMGFYQNDLSENDLLYHYPRTQIARWDEAQVAAVKNAARLGVPVFAISVSETSANRRRVRLGWVQGWDDRAGHFMVTLGEEPEPLRPLPDLSEPFSTTQQRTPESANVEHRTGQARFRYDVMRRCGPNCALCSVRVLSVLETPHVVPVSANGTNDPRNGMVMCATHHRAFDSHLFCIDPDSLAIVYSPLGPTADDLRMTSTGLQHSTAPPHEDALAWRWRHWRRKVKL